jgi:hypothetical protein
MLSAAPAKAISTLPSSNSWVAGTPAMPVQKFEVTALKF